MWVGINFACQLISWHLRSVNIFRFIRRIPDDPRRLRAINPNVIRDISKRVIIFCIWSVVCIRYCVFVFVLFFGSVCLECWHQVTVGIHSLSLIQVIKAENNLNPELQIVQATCKSSNFRPRYLFEYGLTNEFFSTLCRSNPFWNPEGEKFSRSAKL